MDMQCTLKNIIKREGIFKGFTAYLCPNTSTTMTRPTDAFFLRLYYQIPNKR